VFVARLVQVAARSAHRSLSDGGMHMAMTMSTRTEPDFPHCIIGMNRRLKKKCPRALPRAFAF
jgi:hypothetical protein